MNLIVICSADHGKAAIVVAPFLASNVVHVAKRAPEIEVVAAAGRRSDELRLEPCAQARVVLEDEHVAGLRRVVRALGGVLLEHPLAAGANRLQQTRDLVVAAAAARLDDRRLPVAACRDGARARAP